MAARVEELRDLLAPAAEAAAIAFGALALELGADALLPTARRLRDELGFDLLLDVTAVDWPGREPRFDVVYHFYSTASFARVRLKVAVPAAAPAVPTLTGLWGSAAYMERECHDMYGIEFAGNPDLRPILLYEGFVGHPLRKDYPKDREQPLVPYLAEGGGDAGGPLPNPVRPAPGAPPDADLVQVSIGPSHPATHGTIQILAALDGERVARADVHCGYLHRGFEKECEDHTWHNLIPYVDRLNYCSALINNFAYCEAVERLMGIEITPRCRYLRTLLAEYARIADHLTCVGAVFMELGAMTPFLYLMTLRDYIYEHLADLTGARVTHSFGRIGGLANDLGPGWLDRLDWILGQYEIFVGRAHALMDRNRIFIDRMRDVGVLSAADAVSWGFTGPILRSTGAPRDLRKDAPYLAYAELDFAVPVGIKGDNYDRYYVRMCEMDESVRMIRQLAGMLPDGPVCVADHRCTLPEKRLVYSEIESLIQHFKLIMEGPIVPAGEVYVAHESPNGELGFYAVSAGAGRPYKLHVRAPSFVHMGGMHRLLEGYQLADVVPTFGSMNMIGGECDR